MVFAQLRGRDLVALQQRVESFSDTEATVAGQAVPLGRQYREAFLKRFMFR